MMDVRTLFSPQGYSVGFTVVLSIVMSVYFLSTTDMNGFKFFLFSLLLSHGFLMATDHLVQKTDWYKNKDLSVSNTALEVQPTTQ